MAKERRRILPVLVGAVIVGLFACSQLYLAATGGRILSYCRHFRFERWPNFAADPYCFVVSAACDLMMAVFGFLALLVIVAPGFFNDRGFRRFVDGSARAPAPAAESQPAPRDGARK